MSIGSNEVVLIRETLLRSSAPDKVLFDAAERKYGAVLKNGLMIVVVCDGVGDNADVEVNGSTIGTYHRVYDIIKVILDIRSI